MKNIAFLFSFFWVFISCKGEDFSLMKNQDPYRQLELLAQQKAIYLPHPPKNYQGVTIPTRLKYYYQSVDFSKNGDELKEALAVLTITKHTLFIPYSRRHPFLEKANKDIHHPDKVLLVYTGESRSKSEVQKRNQPDGSINTEHIYPQSYIKKYGDPEQPLGDLHHLHYIDRSINSSRGNLPFTDGKGEASRKNKGKAWYPSDEYKGDVARMLLYMFLRYNLPFHHVSTEGVGLLLKWNAQDKVSELELQRNNEIEQAQGNRNPFIDNPYLATKIFGQVEELSAENLWP